MDSFGTVKQTDLSQSGQQRRRYEINDSATANAGSKIAGGLLLANAILVLKSVFFSAESKDDKTASQSATDVQQQSVVVDRPTNLMLVPDAKDKQEPEKIPDEPQRASAASKRSQSTEEAASPEAFGPDPGSTSANVVPFPTASPRPVGVVNQDSVRFADEPAQSNAGGGSAKRASDDPVAANENESDQEEHTDSEPRANRLPVVTSAVVLNELFINQSIAIAMTDLLSGATDPDGDALTVLNLTASSGTVVENAAGDGWTFTPGPYQSGHVTFHYQISDGTGETSQSALLEVLELPGQTFFGTDQSDTIVATPGSDTISTMDGDDTVIAREGDDIIDTGSGNDRIVAGRGDDEIHAGAGNDIVFAGAGDDIVYGGDGNDFISGDDGNDQLFGEDGDDIVLAGLGDDQAYGGHGHDVLEGGQGIDLLDGGAGDDTLSGGAGGDSLFGEDGDDVISGGEGRDFALGGAGNDIITGGAGDDIVEGNGGQDNLAGNDGNDILIGGDDSDTLSGDAGADTLLGGSGDDSISGGAGDDVVVAGAGIDDVDLGDGNDIAVAVYNDGDDHYDGGAGDDTYDASGASEAVVINLDEGTASSVEFGDDQLVDFENAVGGAGDDTIIANESANSLTGGAGNDVFVFIHESSSGSGGHKRDRIEDFEVGDRIDVSLLDGNENEEGLQRLTFNYDQADFDGAGQVLFTYHNQDEDELTLIRFNFDDDDESEFEIEIVGRYDLSEDDFIA